MTQHSRVLALAVQSREEQLGAALVVAAARDGEVEAQVLDPWHGAAGTSLPQQLFTLREVLVSLIDTHSPDAITIRRPESGGRGGPTLAYDAKITAMGIAALVARERGLSFGELRANQLGPKPTDDEVERHCPPGPKARRDLQLQAVATALTALRG